jgi:hypothetical protein
MVWSKNAVLAALASSQPTQEDLANRKQGLMNTVLPKKTSVLPSSQQERIQQLKANGIERSNVVMEGFRRLADPSAKTDYLEQAEQLAFDAAQVKAKADKIRLKKSIPKYKPGETIFIGGGSGAMPVANPGNRKPPPTNRDFGSLVSPEFLNKGGGSSGGTNLGAFINAIAGKESGGNYGAVNPDSGALGKYQIMPANIAGPGGWDMEALGKNVTPEQFLKSPKLQEAIARYKLGQYFKKYGAAGAASAWYSGSPTKWKTSTGSQGAYPSIHNYVVDVLGKLGMKP